MHTVTAIDEDERAETPDSAGAPTSRATRGASAHRGGGVHPRRPPRRVRAHLPPDLPAGAHRQRQLAQPHGRTRGRRERPAERGRADDLRPRGDLDGSAMARPGLHVRRLQPRRVRAPLDRRLRLRRRRLHARSGGVEIARRRPAGDLAALPPRAHLRRARVVDPRADAHAAALHGPPLAPRVAGAPPEQPRLDRAADARPLGEHARERRARRAARHAPRRLRAPAQPRQIGAPEHRPDRAGAARDPRHPVRPGRQPPATTTSSSSIRRSPDRSRSGSGPRRRRTPPRSTSSSRSRSRS